MKSQKENVPKALFHWMLHIVKQKSLKQIISNVMNMFLVTQKKGKKVVTENQAVKQVFTYISWNYLSENHSRRFLIPHLTHEIN